MKSAISVAADFEKHLIQESIKQFLLEDNLNSKVRHFLNDYGILIDTHFEKSLNKHLNHLLGEEKWDYQGLLKDDKFFGTQKDWNTNILFKISEFSFLNYGEKEEENILPNTIIVGKKVFPMMEDLGDFVHCHVELKDDLVKVGKLKERFLVFHSHSLVKENEIILCRSNANENVENLLFSSKYAKIEVLNLKY